MTMTVTKHYSFLALVFLVDSVFYTSFFIIYSLSISLLSFLFLSHGQSFLFTSFFSRVVPLFSNCLCCNDPPTSVSVLASVFGVFLLLDYILRDFFYVVVFETTFLRLPTLFFQHYHHLSATLVVTVAPRYLRPPRQLPYGDDVVF
jgi:hypothetical protein